MRKTNPQLQSTIRKLRKKAYQEKSNLWLRVAEDLEKPTRSRVIVNISKIERNANDGDTIIVPGKVLGTGDLTKKVTVIAYQFSEDARAKISKVGKALDLKEENMPEGKMKIMG